MEYNIVHILRRRLAQRVALDIILILLIDDDDVFPCDPQLGLTCCSKMLLVPLYTR